MKVLCFCPFDDLKKTLEGSFNPAWITYLQEKDFAAHMDSPLDEAPKVVVFGMPSTALNVLEVSQGFRILYQDAVLIAASAKEIEERIKTLLKNGVNETYFLPMDREPLVEAVQKALTETGNSKRYHKVLAADFGVGDNLQFNLNVFLPRNNKYVRFLSEGGTFTEDKQKRLQMTGTKTGYVPIDEKDKFYEYMSDRLMKTGEIMSETEKSNERRRMVRHVFEGLFEGMSETASFGGGKQIVEGVKTLVDKYINKRDSKNILKQIQSTVDDGTDLYSRSARVSAIASLISLGTGIGDPIEIGTAAILMDLGLSLLPESLHYRAEEELTPAEKEIYKSHIDKTFELLKRKKLILSDSIVKMITQHHESFDGTGFPKGSSGKVILPISQILKFADRLDLAINARPEVRKAKAESFHRTELSITAFDGRGKQYSPEVRLALEQLMGQA